MKVSPPLALKALASRIHGQLPLNARESDKLLTLLKTSFRSQLDKVHPTQDAAASRPSTTIQRTPQSAFLSATRNIDAMINNPLLAHNPRSTIVKKPDLTAQFLESIVYGTATLAGAKKYLASIGLAQGKTGPGMIVLDWLRSTALDRSEEFLSDVGLVTLLTRRLTLERKHELLMEELLLDSGVQHNDKKTPKHGQAWRHQQYWKHRIVSCIIDTSVQSGDYPEVTINYFLDIVAACRKAKLQYTTFLTTTAEQIGLMTVARRHEISASIYDNVMTSCSPLIPPRHRASAMLPLYHASTADAVPTLLFLKRLERDTTLIPLADESKVKGTTTSGLDRQHLLCMCLESARLFAKTRPDDAAWLVDFAKRHFQYELATAEQDLKTTVRTTQQSKDPEEAKLRHDIRLGMGSFAFG